MAKNILTHSVDLIPWWFRDLIKKVPFVAYFQRKLVNKYLAGSEFIYQISAGPAKGLFFPIKLPDDKLYWTGTWEKDITEVIYKNIVKGKPSCDIGSHRGFIAGIMALAGSSKVFCFEPNPENIRHLEKLLDLNKILKLTILPYAVAQEDGEAQFSIMPETSMGKLAESSFQPEVSSNSIINVTVKTLDGMLISHEIEAPGFIKIDVEGAELLVLKGAKDIIEQYKPVFVIELHSYTLAQDCINYLKDYGYDTQIIQKNIDLNNEASFRVCHLLARYNK